MQDIGGSAVNTLKAMLKAQLIDRDPEKALSYMTDDMVCIGTSDGEYMRGRQEMESYLTRECEACALPYEVTYLDCFQQRITDDCAQAVVNAQVSGGGVVMKCRVSAVVRRENGEEKMCQLHMSVADTQQQADEFFPFSLAEKYTEEMYHEFLSRNINAGVVGGYLDGGNELYTVNDQYLQMLGYDSREEYAAQVGGDLMLIAHKDDMAEAKADMLRQMAESGQFATVFRMRRKDGGYVWVEDHGRIVDAEDGRRAVVSVCIDVTEQQEALRILREQADQLHLYRISQNAGAFRILAEGTFPLLYGNDRLYQMLGYNLPEQRELLRQGCIVYVHPDDRDLVKAQVEKALGSNDKYTQWVMRIFTAAGELRYMQVVGEFTETKDGCVMEGIEIDVTEQKLTELALFERNAMFDALLDNSSMSMWTYDIGTHVAKLISSRRHYRPITPEGIENYPESVIATGFIKSSSVEDMRAMLKKIDSGAATASSDIWYEPTDGESWCDKVTYISIFDDKGRIIRTLGIAEDVTEQRVAQQQYEEELAYQQSLQSESFLTKVRADLTQNVLESYDAADHVSICRDMMPYDESVETLAQTGYREEDRQLIRRMMNAQRIIESFERGQPISDFDYRRVTKEGRVIWVNISIKTYRDMRSGDIKSFMYTIDVNREKLNEEIIHTVAATEHDYIAMIDLHTDEYRLFTGNVNDAIMPTAVLNEGYAASVREVNKTCVHKDDLERLNTDMSPERIRQNLAEGGMFSGVYQVYDGENELRLKKIQYTWLNRDMEQVIMTRSDVTDVVLEQQRAQELLRNALRQAEQANNAKTDFLSKMSHEIRTPMNAIIGMNALAAQNINDPESVSDCISKVGISARYLLTLINDILDMSRIESGKMDLRCEEIPFEEFIRNVNAVIYTQANQRGVSYDSIITGYVADAYMGDAMKLQQILINLLGNAVKFTPPGGKVQLIISQERTERDKAYMRFTVNDTGVGISEEFQKVMFEPFEQEYTGNTSPYGGTGLGLAITKNLVQLMGGSITVNSILGVGTEFVTLLPLGVCPEKAGYRHASTVKLDKMTALVVDDEILICEQAKSILGEMGMKAEWVTNGHQAVERVREKWAKKAGYDIILVDWKMPDMDGIETARRIRSIVGPDVTIIIITAYEWAEIEAEARAAGVNVFITKPLFRSSLESTIERVMAPHDKEKAKARAVEYDFTGKRALLVEDHLLNVEVARRLLQAKGMAVEVAENGLAAIEAYAASPLGYFDVILMDIRMPVMDGLTATRSIRQMKKKTAKTIPIVAMSANAFDEDVEKSRAAGMNMHLAKPIEPELLYSTLNEIFSK